MSHRGRIAVLVLALAAVFAGGAAVRRAVAQPWDAKQLSELDAAELRADLAEHHLHQARIAEIQAKARPLQDRIRKRLAGYGLTPEEMGKSWDVNFETREILWKGKP